MKRFLCLLLLTLSCLGVGQTWTTTQSFTPAAHAATLTPTTAISTVASPFSDLTNSFYTEPGFVIPPTSMPVATFTAVPTLVISAPNGGGLHSQQAAGTVTLSGGTTGTITAINMTDYGMNYSSCTFSTTGGGVVVGSTTFGAASVSGNIINCVSTSPSTATYNSFGFQGFMTATAPGLNQFALASGTLASSTFSFNACLELRCNTSTSQLYTMSLLKSSSNIQIVVVYANNKTASSGSSFNIDTTITSVPWVLGHHVTIFGTATGSSPTTLQFTVNDDTANPSWTVNGMVSPSYRSATHTDSGAGTQTANTCGIGLIDQRGGYDYIAIGQPAGLSLATNPIGLNQTVNEAVTGTGTTWTPGTYVSTGGSNPFTFNANGTSSTMGTVVVVDATHANIPITTVGTTGTVIVTDITISPNTTYTVSVSAIQVPVPTVTATVGTPQYGPPGSTPVITFTTPITLGVPPYSFQVVDCDLPNLYTNGLLPLPANVPSGHLRVVGTQTISDSVTIPTTVIDSSPISGANYYSAVVTDANGQVVASINTAITECVILLPWTGADFFGIGDSASGQGSEGANSIRIPNHVTVTAGGSGYTSDPLIACAAIPGATFGCIRTAGVITSIYPIEQSDNLLNQNTVYTMTITGGGGSGATGSIGSTGSEAGGGSYMALQYALQTISGKNVKFHNAGVGGFSAHTMAQPAFLNTLVAEITAIGRPLHAVISHGINDYTANNSSAAQYNADVTTICNAFLGCSNIIDVTLMVEQFANMIGFPQGLSHYMTLQYAAQLPVVAASYNGTSNAGKVVVFDPHTNLMSLGLGYILQPSGGHLNDWGYGLLMGTMVTHFGQMINVVSTGGGNNQNGLGNLQVFNGLTQRNWAFTY